MRREPEEHGEGQHGRRAEGDADPSRAPRIQQLSGTVVLADAQGDGIGNPRRNHERHRDDLQGDLVGRQLGAAHGAHAQGSEGEQPDFHRVGAADGQAQSPELAQVLPVRPGQAAAQGVVAIRGMPPDVPGHGQRHAVGDDGGDQADTGQSQPGQAEHPGDERIVEGKVGHGATEADHHHRGGASQGTGKAAQGHEAQVAGQGERQR